MNNHHHQTNKKNILIDYLIRKYFLHYFHVDDYYEIHFHHYVFVVVEDMSLLKKIYMFVVDY
jgi:hypothetical protein